MMDHEFTHLEEEVEKKSDINYTALALVIVWVFLAVSGIIFWAKIIF